MNRPPRKRKGAIPHWERVLEILRLRAGRVVTYDYLITAMGLPANAESWQKSYHTIAAHVARIRKSRICTMFCFVQTLNKTGYILHIKPERVQDWTKETQHEAS